jgi:uncharacterized ferredoxin-like protein
VSSFRPDIWRLQANGDIQGLIRALEADDSALRRRAAAALRTLSAIEAAPTLKRVLDTEPDPETRSSMLAALASLEMATRGVAEAPISSTSARTTPQSQAIEALVFQLSSSEPKQAITAALKLAKLKDMRAVEPLIVQFNNQLVPAKARLLIAEALLELDSAPGDVAVLGALRHAKASIRRSAATVLGQMQGDWAVDPLAQALNDDDESVREAAQTALEAIDTADARAALTAYKRKPTGETTTDSIPAVVVSDTASDEIPEALPGIAGPRDGLLRFIKSENSIENAERIDLSERDQNTMLTINTQTAEENPNENLQKLSWPKREPSQEQNISTMPTRPLDPHRLEEAKDRLEGQGSETES